MSTEARKSWLPVGVVANITPSLAPAEAVGVEAAWERFRHEAAAVDARDVKTFTGNASVVLHNVSTGVGAVMAERAWFEAQADGPRVDFERVAAVESAAEALGFTAAQASASVSVPTTLAAKIKRARVVRKKLRANAEALVEAGVLAVSELPVFEDRGPLDVARACVGWAAFFRAKQAQIRGATGVRSTLVREAGELGSELLREIKPRGVANPRVRSEAERVAADNRDRMAVVVERRYDYVERVACWRWGRDCEAIVPSMRARDHSAGAGEVEGEPEGDAKEVATEAPSAAEPEGAAGAAKPEASGETEAEPTAEKKRTKRR
jgi:hypothetical protein